MCSLFYDDDMMFNDIDREFVRYRECEGARENKGQGESV